MKEIEIEEEDPVATAAPGLPPIPAGLGEPAAIEAPVESTAPGDPVAIEVPVESTDAAEPIEEVEPVDPVEPPT